MWQYKNDFDPSFVFFSCEARAPNNESLDIIRSNASLLRSKLCRNYQPEHMLMATYFEVC